MKQIKGVIIKSIYTGEESMMVSEIEAAEIVTIFSRNDNCGIFRVYKLNDWYHYDCGRVTLMSSDPLFDEQF